MTVAAPPRPAAVLPEPVAVLPDPEASGKTTCNMCWHPRRTHPAGGGCLFVENAGDPKCGCPMTYNDLLW